MNDTIDVDETERQISPAQQKKLNVVRKSHESHVGISILYDMCWVRKRFLFTTQSRQGRRRE